MRYVIVTDRKTIAGRPFRSFDAALAEAGHIFGEDIKVWMQINLRIEEYR